jgi:GAF domain-containing protein
LPSSDPGPPAPAEFAAAPLAAAAAGALARARERLGVRRTALFWLGGPPGRLVCVATQGAGTGDGWLGQTLDAGVGMAGRAVREGRAVWTPDLLGDGRVPIAPWLKSRLEAEGLRGVAAAPVSMDGAIRGALGFLDGPGQALDAEGLRQVQALADELAGALRRARPAGR